MTFKQRIPMGSVDGPDVYVTLEWLRLLNDLGTTTSTPVDLSALTAQITALAASVAALQLRMTKVEDRYEA